MGAKQNQAYLEQEGKMQDTMINDLMIDMWKSVGDMPIVKWMKDASSMKDIAPKQIGIQTLGFQKSAVDNIYKATLLVQEQAEKMAEPLSKNIPGIPEGWSDILKKNQEQIKKAVDESFVKVESYLSSDNSLAKKSQPAKAEKKQKKAETSVK